MKAEHEDALGAELEDLLAAESRFPELDPAIENRLWDAIESGFDGPTGGGGAPAPEAAPRSPLGGGVSPFLSGAAGLVIGVVIGAAVTTYFTSRDVPTLAAPRHEVVSAERTPAIVSLGPASVASETAPPEPVEIEPAIRHRARERRPAPPAHAPASRLHEERALIDAARGAVARNHPGEALAVLERHRNEFPSGELAEEREGLNILALVRAGRRGDASVLAVRFRERYPQSLLWPAIDSALAAGGP